MALKKKHLLITFDFELFLGSKSGSVENCLIIPTIEILRLSNKYNFKTIFFVDTLYLHRLKEAAINSIEAKTDYDKIIKTLKNVIKSGSYVFHHIHPHWLDAIYKKTENQWDLTNKNRFALNNLTTLEIETVFKISNQVINAIYSDNKQPETFGFRAGGLYAQPFSQYKEQMEKRNIKLELSVLKNATSTDFKGRYGFNYSVTSKKLIYKFSNDLLIEKINGSFIEIAMEQFKMKNIAKIINGIYYRVNCLKPSWKRWGDGASSGNKLNSSTKTNKLSTEETYSMELLNNFKARLYLKNLHQKKFIHIISHPKLLSQANIDAFDIFIRLSKKKYNIETDPFKIIKEQGLSLH